MSIHNIALVRAFKKNEFINILKNNGVMKSESKLVVLKPGDTLSDYASGLDNTFKKASVYDHSDIPSTFEEFVEDTGDNNRFHYSNLFLKANQRQLSKMLPLKADYNAELLWAINGLVPDDSETNAFANNTFSNNDYAIICGLEEVLSQETAEVVSLFPTDTAVKGEIKTDSNFTLVIRQTAFEALSDTEKESLKNIGLRIITFDGSLREAIENELDSSTRFDKETPTLIHGMNGFKDSETKSKTLSTLSEVSKKYNIPFIDHLTMAMEETPDYNYVNDFYLYDFINYMKSLNVIPFDYDSLKQYTRGYAKQFGEAIIKSGIDKYKEIVQSYNLNLLRLQKLGLLPTPEQMLAARDSGEELQVYPLFSQLENEKKIDSDSDGYPFDSH